MWIETLSIKVVIGAYSVCGFSVLFDTWCGHEARVWVIARVIARVWVIARVIARVWLIARVIALSLIQI